MGNIIMYQLGTYVKADLLFNIARKPTTHPNIIWKPSLAPSQQLFSWYWRNKSLPNWWGTYCQMWEAEKKNDSDYLDGIYYLTGLVRTGRIVAIGCYCKDETKCHRSLVLADIINRLKI